MAFACNPRHGSRESRSPYEDVSYFRHWIDQWPNQKQTRVPLCRMHKEGTSRHGSPCEKREAGSARPAAGSLLREFNLAMKRPLVAEDGFPWLRTTSRIQER